ncbi:MAG TPA: penicillin acylase family protein, partial [Phnomibacter sp.]|nr:penicillin acylase family protein [Phnomibacter sp.]
MRILKFLLCLIITAGMVYALDTKLGPIPPLGRLLSPSHGLWQNAEDVHPDLNFELAGPWLKNEVSVYLDDRLVPHIFAANDEDACFAQGYLHARFRLWQMEFQTHAASGRLSEILGEKVGGNSVLELRDRHFRRLGMNYAAEKTLKAVEQYPEIKSTWDAYTAGVNYYISQLQKPDYPIEYKLLDYA